MTGPVTLDISTLVILGVNLASVLGGFYMLRGDVLVLKERIEAIKKDVEDVKKKADERSEVLESVRMDVHTMKEMAKHA